MPRDLAVRCIIHRPSISYYAGKPCGPANTGLGILCIPVGEFSEINVQQIALRNIVKVIGYSYRVALLPLCPFLSPPPPPSGHGSTVKGNKS